MVGRDCRFDFAETFSRRTARFRDGHALRLGCPMHRDWGAHASRPGGLSYWGQKSFWLAFC